MPPGAKVFPVLDGLTQVNCANRTLSYSFQVPVALMQAGNRNMPVTKGREYELQILNFTVF